MIEMLSHGEHLARDRVDVAALLGEERREVLVALRALPRRQREAWEDFRRQCAEVVRAARARGCGTPRVRGYEA